VRVPGVVGVGATSSVGRIEPTSGVGIVGSMEVAPPSVVEPGGVELARDEPNVDMPAAGEPVTGPIPGVVGVEEIPVGLGIKVEGVFSEEGMVGVTVLGRPIKPPPTALPGAEATAGITESEVGVLGGVAVRRESVVTRAVVSFLGAGVWALPLATK
jgi:hypothetical protein